MIKKPFLLLLFLLFCSTLFSEEKGMVLENRYYCDDTVVTAEDFFPDIEENFIIGEFKNRSHLQLSAREVQKLFKAHGYDVTITHPVIALSKNSSFDKAPLQNELTARFLAHYPGLSIQKLTIRPRTFFEQKAWTLLSVTLPAPTLTKNKGTFWALYDDGNNRQKKVYFSYKITGNVQVLKAKRNMANGTILSKENTYTQQVPFTRLAALPVGTESLERVRVKGYVKQDAVITESMIRAIPDIVKNQKVRAILKANGLNVTIYATALQDGKIGETIQLKSDNGQLYNARVIDKNKAAIE